MIQTRKIKKILIANRGEIAVRIIRACRDLDIIAAVVYSEADQSAYHVRLADEAYHIGPPQSNQSYLVFDKIIDTAKKCGADAIHPGYGFLSENADFAKRCVDEGIIFIGPKPETIALLGDKLQARETAIKSGMPVVPGTKIEEGQTAAALEKAKEIGFPVLVKAAAGGGGKGMRVVESEDEFEDALVRASSEAKSAFGDGRVFLEKYLVKPRHIEFQILCDQHGNCIHLCERECSIQRRHQKLIEESPSPIITPELREKMGSAAVNIAKESGYVGAGTVEFLVDIDRKFYFLEVNTRLQVEHPVTEMVTGIDLVEQQVYVAEGHKLLLTQDDIVQRGHAIEARICAEDPEQNFMPSTGVLKNYRPPAGPGVRVDSGVVIFNEVAIYYDPMFAKLITWGKDRPEAINRMKRALAEYRVSGIETTIGFHREIMSNKRFIEGDMSTLFLTEEYPESKYVRLDEQLRREAALAAAVNVLLSERKMAISNRNEAEHSGWVKRRRSSNITHFPGAE